MRPFAASRVILHLLQIAAWLVAIVMTIAWIAAARTGQAEPGGLLPILAAAVIHVSGVGVDALIELVQRSHEDSTMLKESRDLLHRMASIQKQSFERRKIP